MTSSYRSQDMRLPHPNNDAKYESEGRVLRSRDEANRRFEGLPELLTPHEAAQAAGISVRTVYDWSYRKEKYSLPKDLIVYIGARIHIDRDLLKEWWLTRRHRGSSKKGKAR